MAMEAKKKVEAAARKGGKAESKAEHAKAGRAGAKGTDKMAEAHVHVHHHHHHHGAGAPKKEMPKK